MKKREFVTFMNQRCGKADRHKIGSVKLLSWFDIDYTGEMIIVTLVGRDIEIRGVFSNKLDFYNLDDIKFNAEEKHENE